MVTATLFACVPNLPPPVDPPPDVIVTPDAGMVAAATLLGSVPTSGANAVALNSPISLTFSRPINQSSLVVKLTPSVPVGSPSWSADGLEANFPALSLLANTAYVMEVSGVDIDGLAMGGLRTISFTTAPESDTVAPSIAVSSPANGSSDVGLEVPVSITFSEAMNPDTFIASIEPMTELSVSWNGTHTVASIAHAAPFETKTEYVLTLIGADLAGNLLPEMSEVRFTTAAPADSIAPTVLSSAPSPAAMNVPTNSALSLSFSEPMNRSAVDAAFSISPSVPGTTLWDSSGTLRSFQPSAPLAASTQYTITLGVGALDLAGNPLAAPHQLVFTTAAVPDTTRPTLVSSSPTLLQKGVSRTADIVLEFSEPMDKAAVQVSFSVTNPPAANVGTFTWSPDGRTMTFNPTQYFDYGQVVSWQLTTGAKDLAGNTTVLQYSRSFTVIKQATVVIDASAGLDGYVSSANATSTVSSYLFVGDSSTNVAYRSFMTFDLSALPTTLTTINTARINFYLASSQGDPDGTLGGAARLQRINYGGALTTAAFDLASEMSSGDDQPILASQTAGWRTEVVTASVTNDWSDRAARSNRTQYRLRFPNQLSSNGTQDMLNFYSADSAATTCPRTLGSGSVCKPYLMVTYEYP